VSSLWWYVARSTGIVAWALGIASVLWGTALATKVLGRRPRPVGLLDLHRFLGGATVLFVVLHVLSILADSYVHFGLVDVLVPFAADWQPAAAFAWVPLVVAMLAYRGLDPGRTTARVDRSRQTTAARPRPRRPPAGPRPPAPLAPAPVRVPVHAPASTTAAPPVPPRPF
jgi:hypothetical protein